ncbi:MAG: hypothetical protein GY951_03085 [Psychromonas sp.]|nr:hypothetical protein [Psychromonas sp.]
MSCSHLDLCGLLCMGLWGGGGKAEFITLDKSVTALYEVFLGGMVIYTKGTKKVISLTCKNFPYLRCKF